jgi:hypothetical protein
MVKVVITLSHGQDRGQDMVARRKRVVVRGTPEPMCNRVDAEYTLKGKKSMMDSLCKNK